MALTKIPGNLIETGAITGDVLADGGIATGKLANDAVTTAKILDANITHAKLHATMDLTGKTVTVATAAGSTNTTAAASTAFVQQELTTLIGGAPGTLDTLNELAAAINDDSNYNTTLTTALATKLPLAGGTMTGAITSASFGSQFATTLFQQNVIKSSVASQQGAFIRMAVSNAGNPTYAFEDDTNTGMFTSGADTLNFTTAGTERMRIDSAGRLLLGTSTPRAVSGEIATVNGDISLTNEATYSTSLTRGISYFSSTASYGVQPIANIKFHTVGDAQSAISFVTRSSAADYSERMRIDSSGNLMVGAGSTSTRAVLTPDAVFQSYYSTETTARIHLGRDVGIGGGAGVAFGGQGGYSLIGTDNTSGTNLYFNAGSNAVGNLTTAYQLMLNGSTGVVTISAAGGLANKGILQFSTQADTYQLMGGNNIGYLGYKTGGYHRWFGSDGVEEMRLSADQLLIPGHATTGGTPIKMGSSGVTQYVDLVQQTNSGTAEFFKAGTGYTAWGGASALNIYNSNEKIAFHPSGQQNVVQMTTAGIVMGAGKGISFGNNANASGMTSEVLDDYEEGTWTPVISHNDGSGVVPMTVVQANYVKIGKLVHLRCYLTNINPNGNAGTTGAYYGIRGMPFTVAGYGSWQMVYASNGVTSYGGYTSAASMYFLKASGSSPMGQAHVNGTTVNSWGSNWVLMMSASYQES